MSGTDHVAGHVIHVLAEHVDAALVSATGNRERGGLALLAIAFLLGRMMGRIRVSPDLLDAVDRAIRLGRMAGERQR